MSSSSCDSVPPPSLTLPSPSSTKTGPSVLLPSTNFPRFRKVMCSLREDLVIRLGLRPGVACLPSEPTGIGEPMPRVKPLGCTLEDRFRPPTLERLDLEASPRSGDVPYGCPSPSPSSSTCSRSCLRLEELARSRCSAACLVGHEGRFRAGAILCDYDDTALALSESPLASESEPESSWDPAGIAVRDDLVLMPCGTWTWTGVWTWARLEGQVDGPEPGESAVDGCFCFCFCFCSPSVYTREASAWGARLRVRDGNLLRGLVDGTEPSQDRASAAY